MYYTDRIMEFSEAAVGKHIEALGTPAASLQFLLAITEKFCVVEQYDKGDTGCVTGGTLYTLFIPNNAAIQQAATVGLLPKKADGTPQLCSYPPGRTTVGIQVYQLSLPE